MAPFLVGRRLLDLGAGEGYVARALRERTEAWICSVDVRPFGRAAGPYVTYDGTRLPFADGAFDTTLILLALHHCAAPDAVVGEAARVTRHRRDLFWLRLLDERLNGYRHGGQMNIPLAFLPPEGWRAMFASRGLTPVATRWLGPWWERLVHHPLLFVLKKRRSSFDAETRRHGDTEKASPRPRVGASPRPRGLREPAEEADGPV